MLELLCKTKCPFRLVYHLCILGDAIIAVALESLIRIVRERKQDADLFIGSSIGGMFYASFLGGNLIKVGGIN